ncbi:MAG: response regulator [Candidatus Hodarchaeales archaeon]|jgi:PAS domain S-box-containing protein
MNIQDNKVTGMLYMPLILHIDDDNNFLNMSEIYLKKYSCIIDILDNPLEVLDQISKKKYDVIVSDYMMPEMDGLELFQILRENGVKIPFIILTGKGREEVALKALNMGVTYYLQKGFDLPALFTELAHFIIRAVERNIIENQLRQSEEKYRRIFQASPYEIVINRLSDGKILEINKKALELMNRSREELIDRTVVEAGIMTEEQREKGLTLFGDKFGIPFEAPFYPSDGRDRFGVYIVDIIEIYGEKYIIQIGREITELKEIERQFQQVFLNIKGCVEKLQSDMKLLPDQNSNHVTTIFNKIDQINFHLKELDKLIKKHPQAIRKY